MLAGHQEWVNTAKAAKDGDYSNGLVLDANKVPRDSGWQAEGDGI